MSKKLNIKIILLFLVLLIFFVLGWIAIGSWNNSYYLQLKRLVPPPITSFLKQTVFLIPTLLHEKQIFQNTLYAQKTHIHKITKRENILKARITRLQHKNKILEAIKPLKAESELYIKISKYKPFREILKHEFITIKNRPIRLLQELLQSEFKWRNIPSYRYFDYQRKTIHCPDSANVILVTGQSNSANSSYSHEYENKLHVNYFNGNCYALKNPVLGATGTDMSSVIPAIASKLTSKTPYIFLATGWGATSIRKWSMDNDELSSYTNYHLKELEKLGSKLSAVIWIQGEDDAHTGITDYKSHFYKMKTKILQGLSIEQNVKFLITQTSTCRSKPRDRKLNKQQIELGNDENTYVTEVTDSLDDGFRYDGCHFNELGIEAIAEEISSVLNNVLGG